MTPDESSQPTIKHTQERWDFLRQHLHAILALALAVFAVFASFQAAGRYFENLAHLEDEQAFVWQAEVLARGKLTLPSPEYHDSFLYPFVIDHQGLRFGKYPLGWPAALSLGVRLDLRSWVNPILAGVSVWLTFLIGRRIFGKRTGLLAAGLTVISPFFLTISASLLSHPFGLALSGAAALGWLTAFAGMVEGQPLAAATRKRWGAAIICGLALGALAITRPWTALGIALPFGIHGISILLRGNQQERWRVLAVGALAAFLASLHLAWQWAASGDPFLNLYTLWWEYDRIGFGPGHGVREAGHTLEKAFNHAKYSFNGGFPDLFGWKSASLVFLPFGVWSVFRLSRQKQVGAILVGSMFPSLILVYLAYWVGSYVLGPRYYFEGLYSLTILSAAGILLLAGCLPRGKKEQAETEITRDPSGLNATSAKNSSHPVGAESRQRTGFLRGLIVSLIVAGLALYNLFFFLPGHLVSFKGLYGISRTYWEPFLAEEVQLATPALVIVHMKNKWVEYGTLLELANPLLDSPYIFVISKGEEQDEKVAAQYPERNVIHYYPPPYEEGIISPLGPLNFREVAPGVYRLENMPP